MYERLLLMRELLSDRGVIVLHCDYHKSHYLRIVMDEVFGPDRFVNEIIWYYETYQGAVKSIFHENMIICLSTRKQAHISMKCNMTMIIKIQLITKDGRTML